MSGSSLASAFDLIEVLRKKAPEYIDLLTASSDAEFEDAFDALLQKAVEQLETNRTHYQHLGEEALTSVLAASLSMPGLSVSQEKHSNGHVDLTIEADHCVPSRKKLGEAKIYDGPTYHYGGISQLLERYSTGREGRGLLIVYVRKRDISGLMGALRRRMDEDLPCAQQGPTGDHILKWSFVSNHAHQCGDDVQISHIGCNLFC